MWYCNRCKREFDEPDWEAADPRYFRRSAGCSVCPCCGSDEVQELPQCKQCRQPIYPGENAYDGMCPDCFQARVIRLLKESPKEVADALDVLVEAV